MYLRSKSAPVRGTETPRCWSQRSFVDKNFTFITIFIAGMTSLELWCLSSIGFTFGALLSYVVILFKIKIDRNNSSEIDGESSYDSIELILFLISLSVFMIFNCCFWFLCT